MCFEGTSIGGVGEVNLDSPGPEFSILDAEICINHLWVDENEGLLRRWMLDPTFRCHHHELQSRGESGNIEIVYFNGDQPRDATRAFIELARHVLCRSLGWNPLFREQGQVDRLIAEARDCVFNIDSSRQSGRVNKKIIDHAVELVEFGAASDTYRYYCNGRYSDERPVAMEQALRRFNWGVTVWDYRWNEVYFMGHGALGWFLFEWGTGA